MKDQTSFLLEFLAMHNTRLKLIRMANYTVTKNVPCSS